MKGTVRQWNIYIIGNVTGRVTVKKKELHKIQTQLQRDPLDEDLIKVEREAIIRQIVYVRAEESFQRKKSREQEITMA